LIKSEGILYGVTPARGGKGCTHSLANNLISEEMGWLGDKKSRIAKQSANDPLVVEST
jgi:hypothetical protein